MVRTQILLKERQYTALKSRARREGKSLSEAVRAAVSQWLGKEASGGKAAELSDLCGLFRDPGGPSGREHDWVLYDRK